MKYALDIREQNIEPHLDIEKAIEKRKNGTFTCIIRCNSGNIVDIVLMEYATARDYFQLKSVTIEEHTVAFNPRTGNSRDGIRATDMHSAVGERANATPDS